MYSNINKQKSLEPPTVYEDIRWKQQKQNNQQTHPYVYTTSRPSLFVRYHTTPTAATVNPQNDICRKPFLNLNK